VAGTLTVDSSMVDKRRKKENDTRKLRGKMAEATAEVLEMLRKGVQQNGLDWVAIVENHPKLGELTIHPQVGSETDQ
jgi:hypothetical protein